MAIHRLATVRRAVCGSTHPRRHEFDTQDGPPAGRWLALGNQCVLTFRTAGELAGEGVRRRRVTHATITLDHDLGGAAITMRWLAPNPPPRRAARSLRDRTGRRELSTVAGGRPWSLSGQIAVHDQILHVRGSLRHHGVRRRGDRVYGRFMGVIDRRGMPDHQARRLWAELLAEVPEAPQQAA